jgi:putative ABC transport system ATP-binding protein
MPENAPLVEAEKISKDYLLGKTVVPAVHEVSLTVARGAFTVISGPSGSGKSTLLHVLGCLDKPTAGKLHIAGQDVANLSDRDLSLFRARRLGFIFQSFNLIPVLSALENVEYPMRINHVPRAESKARAAEMLESVGLADYRNHRPTEMSGGQCQRIAIGRALIMKPDLVLADEPTANLDSATGEHIMNLMHDLKRKLGTAFVISTHDPMVAAQAEQKILMRDGKLQANA